VSVRTQTHIPNQGVHYRNSQRTKHSDYKRICEKRHGLGALWLAFAAGQLNPSGQRLQQAGHDALGGLVEEFECTVCLAPLVTDQVGDAAQNQAARLVAPGYPGDGA
jgi:hypothetical protein